MKWKAFAMFYLNLKFQSGLSIRSLGHLHQYHYLQICSVIKIGKESLCVIFVVPSNLNDVSPGQDTKYFHEFQCRLEIEGDLIDFKVPKETYVGSFGLWLYISHMGYRKHLNERSCITPLIGTNGSDIEIKMCGARILYEQDMGEFLQNLNKEIFESPNDRCEELKSLLSSLYQVCSYI